MNLTDTGRIVLQHVDLFSGLPADDLSEFHRYLEVRRAPKGTVLFNEGDEGDSLYVVRHGAVQIIKRRDEGDLLLAQRGPGEIIGEMAIVDSAPRFATAVCQVDTELFVLSRAQFHEVIQRRPEIASRILRVLAARVRETDNADLQQLERKNRDLEAARDRLEHLLCELESSNRNLEAALSYRDRALAVAPYPVIVTDAQNQVRLINPAAMALFGPAGDGDLWSWVKPALAAVPDSTDAALQRNVTWKGEVEVTGQSGRTLICKLVAAPITDTGEGTRARLWIFEDLTEMRLLEQQTLRREHLATKGEMAAEIAHELNNFLAVLSGNAELLTMTIGDSVPEKVQKRLHNMCETIERIKVFTDNLLHSRHPTGQKSTINLNAFLDNQIAFLRPQRRIKKIPIHTEWDEGLPELTCDASAIQQVFYNLVLNAADALAGASGNAIGVWVKTLHLPDERKVRLTVADSGPGIPDNLLPVLFKERISTKPSGHGFGLLTIARIISDHGGSISVRNRAEGGAEFEVLLPADSTAS